MERGRPDLILILTPSGLHYEHSKIALKKGCHVLVEKPMTMLPCQSKELEEFAVSKNLMYGVVFQNRFNPAIQALKKALENIPALQLEISGHTYLSGKELTNKQLSKGRALCVTPPGSPTCVPRVPHHMNPQ